MNAFDSMRDSREAAGLDLCPYGCYWECEHRSPSRDAAALRPVQDGEGRALRRCRECGQMFYSTVEHSREHERLRQLGLVPDQQQRWLLEDPDS